MTPPNAHASPPRLQVQNRFGRSVPQSVSVFRCLIVSADLVRRRMFEQAADEGGWNASLCDDPVSALTLIGRSLVQLAIIDLEAQTRADYQRVVERLSSAQGVLLIVCGNTDDLEEELWVRQLGAWMYLPGVIEGNNLALLCGEARHIAQRLGAVSGSATSGNGSASGNGAESSPRRS